MEITEEYRQALLRINRAEKLLIEAMEAATEEMPGITCEEVAAAMMKILTRMNDLEIQKHSK